MTGTPATSDTAERPVEPSMGVTVADGNAGATDSLVLTLTSGAGTLTGELQALSFTPADATPSATVTSTFQLVDTSSAGTSATDMAAATSTPTPAPSPAPTPPPTTTPAPTRIPIAPSSGGVVGVTPSDTVSLSNQVTYADGVFMVTGTASSAVGVAGVEISAQVDGVATDLGAATVDSHGAFTFSDTIGAHIQGFITAIETDGMNGTASAQASYSLMGGLGAQGDAGRQTRYDVDGSAETAVTRFRPDGSEGVSVLRPGQTFASSSFDTFRNGAAPLTTFVFNPGFGRDVVDGFRPDNVDHGTLDLEGSDYGDDIAAVLHRARDTAAGLLITDPVASSPGAGGHDTLLLKGITKQTLTAYAQQDIVFHA